VSVSDGGGVLDAVVPVVVVDVVVGVVL